MKINRKFLIIGVLCVTVLAATIGGVAIASADDNEDPIPPPGAGTELMDKVAEIYQQNTGIAIDPQELQKAFGEAQTALHADRIDTILQKLVEDGKLTQEQADQWKAWLDSRPSGVFNDEFKTWLESRPDVPGMFRFGMFEGRGPGKNLPLGLGECFEDENGATGMMQGIRFNIEQR